MNLDRGMMGNGARRKRRRGLRYLQCGIHASENGPSESGSESDEVEVEKRERERNEELMKLREELFVEGRK